MSTSIHRIRSRRVLAAGLLAALAVSGPVAQAPAAVAGALGPGAPVTTTVAGPASATTQGFIMSDGRVCDPIRHMGC